jgi:hypothetical protein
VRGDEKLTTQAVNELEGWIVGHVGAHTWQADVMEVLRQKVDDQAANLREIRAVVDRQAEDEGLWGVGVYGTQPITEAYLQQELRHLHKIIEDYTSDG